MKEAAIQIMRNATEQTRERSGRMRVGGGGRAGTARQHGGQAGPAWSRRSGLSRPFAGTVFALPLLAALMLAVAAPPAAAQPVPSVTIEATNNLVRDGDGAWSAVGIGRGELSLTAPSNPNTRGELRLELTAGANQLQTELSRAWVRARFPWFGERSFHVTAGKASLTWGEGLFYNAGDVIFGTELDPAELTGSVERSRAAWLAHAFLPTGTFSFFEPVVVVPLPDYAALAEDPTAFPEATDTAAGLRYQARLGNLEIQSGYFVDGAEEEHRPYLSVNGYLGLDLYAAVSSSVPHAFFAESGDAREDAAEEARDAIEISAGALHTARLPGSQQLSVRLETVLRPYAKWEEQSSSVPGAGDEDGGDTGTSYALELYPEIVWTLSPNFTLYARSVVSPVDLSALVTPGVSWNLYNGLSLQLFTAAQLGEESDTYGFERYGGVSVSAIVRYVY